MRKNTQTAFAAWLAGKSVTQKSISSTGNTINSYGTRVLWKVGEDVFLNVRSYSPTTSRQQNDLRMLLAQNGINFTSVEGDH